MKTIYLFIAFIAFSSLLVAQDTETYEALDFIYIDNSRPSDEDVFDLEKSNIILEIIGEAKEKDHKIFIYSSVNGDSRYTINKPTANEFLEDLLLNETPYARNQFVELRNIREAFYNDKFRVKDRATFHFFISEKFTRDMRSNGSPLINLLPLEIAESTKFHNPIHLNVYTTQSGVNTQKLEEKIKFQNRELNLDLKIKVLKI